MLNYRLISVSAKTLYVFIRNHVESFNVTYVGCSGSSWNLVIKISNIDIILSLFDISQVDINGVISHS